MNENLEKAITKAYKNGWDGVVTEYAFLLQDGALGHWPNLFNQNFAKALWKGTKFFPELMYEQPLWEYHLQNMAIADDPLNYLGENI